MPHLTLTSRFSCSGTVDDDDLAAVRAMIANGQGLLDLEMHSGDEAPCSFEIDRKDCVRGGFELRLEGNTLFTDADFTARIRLPKPDIDDILGTEDRTWFSRGVAARNRRWWNDAGDRRDGLVKISLEVAAVAAPGGKAARTKTASGPRTVLTWRIDAARIDVDGTDPEPQQRKLYKKIVASLKKGSIGPDEAGELIRPSLTFEFDSQNLNRRGSIKTIVAASALVDGEFTAFVPLDRNNSEVSADPDDGDLAVTAEISVPIPLRAGVSPSKATAWLERNGGEFGGCLGPWSLHGDAGQSIRVEAEE